MRLIGYVVTMKYEVHVAITGKVLLARVSNTLLVSGFRISFQSSYPYLRRQIK